ncbi:exodeoxyribonuclease V subunit beta [Cupriavidus sp. AU9028]|uniref:UvrD-helicase domain-containing protein n=1 Tax=Cupriavidus sp. AU9028 TaxID=2871157 RepID=UPI001C956F3E|nr:UvrD-helicase domain-containing protein [Cupriavidus sp. AU9028]MBY4896217.1 UvrD-helicase domain-containing protein [Cupriavidus sp. AU9028]
MTVQPYLRDGEPVAEADFTRAACDPGRSVVVEACAGSGKTWLLVARLVRLLLAGAEPSQILAITFTRKAAEEMRERLMDVLAQLASDPDDEVIGALVQRGLPRQAALDALPRARRLHARVLASPSRIAIDTFHGWFGTLLRGAPLASGIVPGASLREDALRMKREAWAPFWRGLSAAEAAPYRAAYERLVDAIGEFSTRALLDAMFHARSEYWAMCEHAGAADAPERALAEELGDDARVDVLAQALADAVHLTQCRDLAQSLGQGGKTEQAHAERIGAALDAIDQWTQQGSRCGEEAERVFALLWSAFFTGNGKPRSLRRTAALVKAAGGDGMVDALLGRHADLCDALRTIAARRCEAAVLAVNRDLYLLGDALLQRYQQYKGEQRAMDFGDLEWLAARLMADEETATYLQVRLDARYRHLLLDEFQDTNPLQWRILRGWFAGYADQSERPTVFLVGDPKQSIYRFRRADARLFDVARDLLREEFGATVLRTNRTRRNGGAVLRWVNAVFDTARDEGRYPIYDTQTTALDQQGGPVWLLPLVEASAASGEPEQDNADGEGDGTAANPAVEGRDTLTQPRASTVDSPRFEEGRRVAAWLRRLRASVPVLDAGAPQGQRPACWRDMMLLVKRKTYLADYERAFRQAGIPCLSPRRGGLLATLEALDLSALLAFLMTPDSDLDLAHVLKSPIGGASDGDLAGIARLAGERRWWSVLESGALPESASAALRDAVPRLREWLHIAPHRAVHDLIDHIYHSGELRRRYAEAAPVEIREQVLANLDAFLKLSLDLDGGRYPSLPKFIDELKAIRRGDEDESPDEGGLGDSAEESDALPDAAGAIDAVRILTVHAAKGLEAPFVVLMDANHSGPPPDNAGILIDWPPSAEAPVHFSAYGKRSERGLARAPRFEAEAALAERENWNLLYVAMTRAQQGLLVSGVLRERGKADAEGEDSEIAGSWYVRLAAAGIGEAIGAYSEDAGSAVAGQDGEAPAAVRFSDFRLRWLDAQEAGPDADAMGTAASFDPDDEMVLPPAAEDAHGGVLFDAAAARHGELVHALIERLTRYPEAFEGVPDIDTAMRWFPLAGDAAARGAWREQVGQALDIVRRMLAAPALRPLLFPSGARQARNEVELYDARGRLLRIDRLVEFEDRVVVIDYKLRLLPQERTAYAGQLRRYVAALRPLFPGRAVDAGIATADGEWIALAQLEARTMPEQGVLF